MKKFINKCTRFIDFLAIMADNAEDFFEYDSDERAFFDMYDEALDLYEGLACGTYDDGDMARMRALMASYDEELWNA